MSSTYDSTVNSLYLAFYGRPADPAGLKFWSQALTANNGDASAIIQAFATSQEAQTRFGSDTVSARITDIYEQLFNRAPDAAGLAFWTNAVEQGNATLAEVSLAILKGAQSSDLDLSTLRQKAADAFTAAVEDGSTEYSGYASIEAARVLVRGVTAHATDADLAKLVKAAVSFADTATKNPKVVEAIATGSTLLNLYDTTRGTKDPVGLTQALADTAKAAAGDPVTLESLLRGGGMDKVLKVMPAKATLTDVVEALAKGGLPAAVEVVYPTAPTAPIAPTMPSFKIAFDHVDEGLLDRAKGDTLTNVEEANVTFKYSGTNAAAAKSFEASIDGVHWKQLVVKTDLANRIVTVEKVDLTGAMHSSEASPSFMLKGGDPENKITTVQLRALDANQKVIDTFAQKIEFDGYVASPFIKLAEPVSKNGFNISSMPATANAVFDVDYVEKSALVEYGTSTFSMGHDVHFPIIPETVWSKDKPVLKDGMNYLQIRQTDLAGNVSTTQVNVVLDTEKPAGTPTVTLAAQNGGSSSNTGTTGPNTVSLTIGNLDQVTNVGWEYSTDKGVSWIYGGRNDGTGAASLSVEKLASGPIDLLVRQFDVAGNVSDQSTVFLIDAAKAPDPKPAFLVAYDNNTLFITGTSTDGVLVDLTADTYARADESAVAYPNKFSMVNASGYAGSVTVSGTVMELVYAYPSFMKDGIDGFVVADAKSHIFSGAPGARAFATEYVEFLINKADQVKVSDTLSMEERALFDSLPGFDSKDLIANVDTEAPLEPSLALAQDTGIPDDGQTTVGDVVITKLESSATFQYRLSETGPWMEGTGIVEDSATITLTGEGQKYLDVRQFDAAGNESYIAHLTFILLAKDQADSGGDAGGGTSEPPYNGDSDSSGSSDSDVVDGDVDVVGSQSGPGIP